MKKIYCLSLLCVLFMSCKNEQKERLKELQDAAHVWNIYNTNLAVVQSSIFYSSEKMKEHLPGFCDYNIKRMDSLDGLVFLNDTTSKLAKRYVKSTRKYLLLLRNAVSLSDSGVQTALINASSDMDTLMIYAIKRYGIDRFTPLRKESYIKAIAKKQYRKAEDDARFDSLKYRKDWHNAAWELFKIYEGKTDPNERAVALLDYADLCVYNLDHWKDGEDTIVLNTYAAIAFSYDFHFYKYEAWRKWRCLYQYINYGCGEDAFIFNKFYDNKRFIPMQYLAEHLEKEPTDSILINEYLLLATHGPLLRYGDFNGGNEAVAEMRELFSIELDLKAKEIQQKEEPRSIQKTRKKTKQVKRRQKTSRKRHSK